MLIVHYEDFNNQNDITTLKGLSSFGALDDAFLRFILEKCDIVSASSGEILFETGSVAREFYIIVSGQLCVHAGRVSQDDIVNRFKKGESVGFISMLTLQECLGDTVVEADAILIRIDSDLFASLHRHNGEQFSIFLINLARNMGRAYRRIETLDTPNPHG